MSEPPTTEPDAARASGHPFRAVLSPHRSLSAAGFVLLMSALCLVSFVSGMAFVLMGAWPVAGFFGLDVLLIYIAFKVNYRAGRAYETVELTPQRLTLTRYDARGRSRAFEFNPYWVRVLCPEAPDGRTELKLAASGQELGFGQCLTDEERREFAAVLKDALAGARQARAF